MSYDYSSSDRQLNLPNPFKIENIFLSLSALAVGLLGLTLLFLARTKLSTAAAYGQYIALITGVVMIFVAVVLVFRVLTQLRFFFGRGRPASLAPDLTSQQTGESIEAAALKETIRQQALIYPEPSGALSGLLYTYVPNLIHAPLPLQALATRQFKNAITMFVLLASLIFALMFGRVGTDDGSWQTVSQWMGLAYLSYVVLILLQPSGALLAGGEISAELSLKGLVFVIAFSIVGPVLLIAAAKYLPAITFISPYPAVFVVMLVALAIYTLFFTSLIRHVSRPPFTNTAAIQESWNINCHPGQIAGEFDRAMQENWEEKIPNRRYLRRDANLDVNAKAGQFLAEIVEETQPFPLSRDSLIFSSALTNPRYILLVLLDIVGAMLWCLTAGALFQFGQIMLATGASDAIVKPYTYLLYAAVFGLLAAFAFRAAHLLWNRFDFTSRVVWLEMQGQFTSTRLDHGNQLNDTIRSSTNAIKIEAMTFRLWCANITSTTLGKDSTRHIVAMAGDTNFANTMRTRLHEFAMNQANIFAPTSRADIARHVELSALNQASRDPGALAKLTAQLNAPQAETGAMANVANAGATTTGATNISVASVAATLLQNCPACGANIASSSAFCSECGHKLQE